MSPPDQTPQPRKELSWREPILNIPGVVTVLIAVCVAVHLVRTYVLSQQDDFVLLVHAAFIPLRYSADIPFEIYAVTTPVTYAFLHGSALHLGVNMVWLAAVGSPLANRIGAIRFLLFWLVTAAAAAGLHYVVHPTDNAPLVGASGAISGMMAASARYFFRIDRSQRRPPFAGVLPPLGYALRSRQIIAFTAIWMGGNLLIGLFGAPGVSDTIAWEAHVGGFLAGFLLLGLFDRQPTVLTHKPIDA